LLASSVGPGAASDVDSPPLQEASTATAAKVQAIVRGRTAKNTEVLTAGMMGRQCTPGTS
jgi:hypothetical protein